MKIAPSFVIGSCLLLAVVAIANDKPKVVVSGQPVEQAFVQVSADCPPETRQEAAGKSFPIPSDREYKLEVRAPGFESWHYTTDTGYVRLEPEQELRLEVQLKRNPQERTK